MTSKVVIFALVAKRDFPTIPSLIDNLQGQFAAILNKSAFTNILSNDEKSQRFIFSKGK